MSDASRGDAPANDAVRRFRHDLRTPVNHLLGYGELLLEDAPGGEDAWSDDLRRLVASGRGLLPVIDRLVEAVCDDEDPAPATAALGRALDDIDTTLAALTEEATRRADEAVAADLAVIRAATAALRGMTTGRVPAQTTGSDSGPAVARPSDSAPSTGGLHGVILVVDDIAENRQILARRLERLGHTVVTAASGPEGLTLLRDRPVDLLLLDVMMPGMDGFAVLERLKADPALREMPVLMLSALDEVAAAVRCIELGADDYLTKPVDTVLLRARIGACLERKRLRDTELAYLRQAAQVTGLAVMAQLLVGVGGEETLEQQRLRADIEREIEWLDLPKGDTLFVTGDPGDSAFIVTSGRLRIDEPADDGGARRVGEVRRGGTLGELEMLTGQPRTTTVTAVRDARLARLDREGFARLAAAYPRLLTRATSDVIDHLREAFQRRPDPGRVTTFALLAANRDQPAATLARRLAGALGAVGDTLLLDRQSLAGVVGEETARLLASDTDGSLVAGVLDDLELQHRYVVYVADAGPSAWTRRCLRQADRVLVAAGGAAPEADLSLAGEVGRCASGVPVDLLILHDASLPRPTCTAAWLDAWPADRHHHMRLDRPADLERVVRRLTGTGVGLVLGGGGARGWAHAGVLRAIEEAGLPLDVIAGTSMGALVGALPAIGCRWPEIEAYGRVWSTPRQLFDYTLPLVSLLAGRKMGTMLDQVYGDAMIEDLWTPFFCVSSSLSRARPVIHRRGPVRRALRASMSLPGILPPVQEGGELLIDGAYLNNLPTEIMREELGGGSVIAVSVSEAVELLGGAGFGPEVSGWEALWRRLLPGATPVPAPSLGTTVMRAAALSGLYHHDASTRHADLVIEPPVGHFGTLDFGAYERIVEAGYEAACRQIEAWQRARDASLPA